MNVTLYALCDITFSPGAQQKQVHVEIVPVWVSGMTTVIGVSVSLYFPRAALWYQLQQMAVHSVLMVCVMPTYLPNSARSRAGYCITRGCV